MTTGTATSTDAMQVLSDACRSLVASGPVRDYEVTRYPADSRVLIDAARLVLATKPTEQIRRLRRRYLDRWHLTTAAEDGRDYLHLFRGNDPDIPHDHPWPSRSLVLDGGLIEYWWTDGRRSHREAERHRTELGPGMVVDRPALHTHRLVLTDPEQPVITLFATEPKVRNWGFWDGSPPVFVPWPEWYARHEQGPR